MAIPGPLAVVGGGRMGSAIIGGLLAADSIAVSDVVVAEPDDARRAAVAAEHGVRCVVDASEAVAGARVVLLAVKPQVIGGVLALLVSRIDPAALVVSIAAGVTCARLEAALHPGTAVVRVMPNTPALVRCGMSAVSGGTCATPEQVELVRDMFADVGDAIVVDESAQDVVTAVSGSGPAYFATIVDALAEAGEARGLDRADALRLAVATMRGTAELLAVTGMSPAELVEGVSSPGGTTVAALLAMDERDLRGTLDAGVDAAVRRAKEL